MRKIIFMLLCGFAMSACEKEHHHDLPTAQCPVKGRWITKFNTMYEFTDSMVYTIYSTNGKWGTIADAIPNPGKWRMEGDSLVQTVGRDVFRTKPVFSCDCKVFRTTSTYLQYTNTAMYWKEGHDTTVCK